MRRPKKSSERPTSYDIETIGYSTG